jgi:O-glycosyl hydrolase
VTSRGRSFTHRLPAQAMTTFLWDRPAGYRSAGAATAG